MVTAKSGDEALRCVLKQDFARHPHSPRV